MLVDYTGFAVQPVGGISVGYNEHLPGGSSNASATSDPGSLDHTVSYISTHTPHVTSTPAADSALDSGQSSGVDSGASSERVLSDVSNGAPVVSRSGSASDTEKHDVALADGAANQA